jgi:hypothetical protein
MTETDLTKEIGRKGADIAGIADRVIECPGRVADLIEGVQAPRGAIRFNYEKTLRLISEKKPDLIYPHFDLFVRLFDGDNHFLKWGAIMTIANLTAVDSAKKFESLFEKYYAPIKGPVMVTAANIIGSSPRIVGFKPHLTDRVAGEILKVEKARYQIDGCDSPECRNVAIGHAIAAFAQFFDGIADKPAVLKFATRHLKNPRPAVAKKAGQLLRKHPVG